MQDVCGHERELAAAEITPNFGVYFLFTKTPLLAEHTDEMRRFVGGEAKQLVSPKGGRGMGGGGCSLESHHKIKRKQARANLLR